MQSNLQTITQLYEMKYIELKKFSCPDTLGLFLKRRKKNHVKKFIKFMMPSDMWVNRVLGHILLFARYLHSIMHSLTNSLTHSLTHTHNADGKQ